MRLEPNTAYFVWFAYENHADGQRGVPCDALLRFQPEKPEDGDNVHWANIGMIATDGDGCVPFFKQHGAVFHYLGREARGLGT